MLLEVKIVIIFSAKKNVVEKDLADVVRSGKVVQVVRLVEGHLPALLALPPGREHPEGLGKEIFRTEFMYSFHRSLGFV